MMSNITLETPKIEEWEKYKALRLKALQTDPTAFGTLYEEEINTPDDIWKQRLQDYIDGKSIGVFARDGENLIGMMVAYWVDKKSMSHIANLVAVYVDENYRGQGIASKILEEIIRRIKEKKVFKKVKLQVMSENLPAISLYKKFGFVEIGRVKDELFIEGKYWDDILMELYL